MKGTALERGRTAARQQSWSVAFSQLAAADQEAPLEPEDLEMFSTAAQLTGRESENIEILSRAHHRFLEAGDKRPAARTAFWLGFTLMNNGEFAQGGGWLARAARLLEGELDCVEKAYLLLPPAMQSFYAGDAAAAYQGFVQAAARGGQFGDRNLMTLSLQGQGRALIRLGEARRGVTLLDEAMVAVTANEVSPLVAGAVYCSVIESCRETLDLGRAQEWTEALHQWCASQPEFVPFRGHCLLHRAEIMQLRGAWAEALDEVRLACERLSLPKPKPSLGAAFYHMAELHRLRGNHAQAEESYRQASQLGRTPQPGFARLRLAQGQLDAACAAIRGAEAEAPEPVRRAAVLDAFVEIMLAANDIQAARGAADQLAAIAEDHGAPILNAMSAATTGAVLLREGDHRGAIARSREAWKLWSELDAPHEAARVRVLIALASRELGDRDTSDVEMSTARETFERLGAVTDLLRVSTLANECAPKSSCPLTSREVEVVKLLASGATNKEIATQLGISEKTVARHVSNIFVKLDLSSRAAATAYAYRQGLV